MSDARTEFFSSSAKPSKPAPSRDDFFAGADIDLPDTPAKERPREFSSVASKSGFGRGGRAPTQETLDAMRNSGFSNVVQGAIDDPMGALKAIPSGINRGVAQLAGMPVDTMANAIDIGGMLYGGTRSLIQQGDLGASEEFYTPIDRANQFGSGEFNASMLDRASEAVGGSQVTQNESPDNPAARLLYAGASGVPGAMTGRMAVGGAVGGAASQVVAEAGGGPAAQAAAAMAGGHAASPQAKLNAAAAKQSMGASGAAVDLTKMTPEMRNAYERAVQKTGGAVNPEASERYARADSLPVPVRLLEGQALRDQHLMSIEFNAKGKQKGYSDAYDAQGKALVENTQALRDKAGPDVFSTNPVEHADTLMARYEKIDEARNADISTKYQALRDANGGQFPVDAPALLADATNALHTDLLFDHAPPAIMKTLERLAEKNSMTFENFESLRTQLANIQRSHTVDGNVQAAAGVIRDAMERLPLAQGAENLKPLADAARAAARERFSALAADPAYKAVVNNKVPPDKFIERFVIGGDRDKVALLAKAMDGDDVAKQTVKVATLDHLRRSAGIDDKYNGKFAQAGYNKQFQRLEPKLGFLLDPELVETSRNLGETAYDVQVQPHGSFFNNSGSAIQLAAEHAGDVLEGAANVKAGGIPVGSWVRNAITDRGAAKRAQKSLDPASGLTKLNELMKGKDKP